MMDFNDYRNAVLADGKEYINSYWENYESDEWDNVYDDMFVDDGVTGNGSGSYTFNSAAALDNVRGLLFDEDFQDAMREFGYTDLGDVFDDPESTDVRTRCAALGEVSEKLEEYFDSMFIKE